jgi:hypothetical protein
MSRDHADLVALYEAALARIAALEATQGWRVAALLKVRTRQAIAERVQAGDAVAELAEEYDVPAEWVETISAPGFDFSARTR